MKLKILSNTPHPEKVIAQSAKLCYSPVGVDEIGEKLTPEAIEKFVKMLVSMGHESPLEHVSFTFAVEGISRACSHQIVRHRIASFSQQSQRYVKLEQFEYIVPPEIESIPMAKKVFLDTMKRDQEAYDELVEILIHKHIAKNYRDKMLTTIASATNRGSEFVEKHIIEHWDVPCCGVTSRGYVAKFSEIYPKEYGIVEKKAIEDARYVFPNACETKMVFTMNVRSLYNFLEHRCCERAQWEIREVAIEMLRQLKEIAPILFHNQGANCVKGACPEGAMTCGNIVQVREKFKNL